MQTDITPDAQVVLLLCGRFSPKEQASPLEPGEYNRLAAGMRDVTGGPAALLDRDVADRLDWNAIRLDRSRVLGLLERGAAMAMAVERWTSSGLWILSRSDDAYPPRLRTHLGKNAPVLLFGVGDTARLERGGLAIVGARDIDEEGSQFTADVARQCARESIPVVSGGARGVDEIALTGAFEEGGHVVAALPEGLGRASLAAKYREGLREDRLVLVSPYAPHAPFSVGNAMARNKLIYALADAALVVSAALRSGGTWAGAEEELKREHPRRLYVRRATPAIEGNEALLRVGGVPFPEEALHGGMRELLQRASEEPMSLIADPRSNESLFAPREHAQPIAIPEPEPVTIPEPEPELPQIPRPKPDAQERAARPTAYDAVLPLLLELLAKPASAKEVAEALDVAPPQAKKWLDRALQERRITQSGKPSKYRRAETDTTQPSLFG